MDAVAGKVLGIFGPYNCPRRGDMRISHTLEKGYVHVTCFTKSDMYIYVLHLYDTLHETRKTAKRNG